MKETKKSTDDTIEYHGPNILDSAIRSLTMAIVRRLCIVSMYCIYLDYLTIIGVGKHKQTSLFIVMAVRSQLQCSSWRTAKILMNI